MLAFRTCLGDCEHPTAEVLAIPHGNSTFEVSVISHLHEAEATGATSLAISHDGSRCDLTCLSKCVAELVSGCAVRKSAHKQFTCHIYAKYVVLIYTSST